MTTYNATTAADVYGYLVGGGSYPASYSAGDIISIAAGAFLPSGNIVPADGRLAGVTVRGAGIGKTIIRPVCWAITIDGTLTIEDLTIDTTGLGSSLLFGSVNIGDGQLLMNRVEISGDGNNTNNAFTVYSDDIACVARLNKCRIVGADADCVSTKAPSGAALAAMSHLLLIDCYIAAQGPNGNDQCLTTHDGCACDMVAGVLRSSDTGVPAAPDAATSRLTLHRVGVPHGTVNANVTGTWWTPSGWQSRN